MQKDANIAKYFIKPAKIIENRKISSDLHLLKIKLMQKLHISIEPFNFFNIWVPRVDEIPLSIAYADNESLFFLYKVRGLGTKTLSQLNQNSFIGVKGPLGKGFKPLPNEKWLVIAGGVGIAPVPFLLKWGLSLGTKIDVVWGVKKSSEFFDVANVFNLPQEGWKLIKVSEDCIDGLCGLATDVLSNMNIAEYDVIIAIGPQQMLKTFCTLLKDKENAYVSLENIVKCGFGVCGSCYVKESQKLVCIDGPVFKCSEAVASLENTLY
ncbi:hypothetical protein QPL79_03745 [Ignisphaera sp. 4213-co]|uniref:FAD-binding FR-type domain-containing protein n=1 Tax=Ignisphaera cupida TaxID=3050454 RepID=A0ABD4Z6B2_9CREN|nr:hypothetical protein [Ignisphaera sp. 4213-co]MDK6028468.1 hypothetical protein [Ignisphaera sp. 4213-co]